MDELRRSYHDDLDHAKDELVRLAAVVTESIPRATAVLLEGDLEGADYLIRGDDEIDARCIDLEEHCFEILALQAPVARDLRQVIALIKMVAEVERSADLPSSRIARRAVAASYRIAGRREERPLDTTVPVLAHTRPVQDRASRNSPWATDRPDAAAPREAPSRGRQWGVFRL